jgi:hypothetical protein
MFRGQTRIAPEYFDIQETLKKQIGKTTDDDYIDAQAGSNITIVGLDSLDINKKGSGGGSGTLPPLNWDAINQAAKKSGVSVDDYYITLDNRLVQTYNLAVGQFTFDPSVYLKNQNILDFSLNNVIEMTILGPFFIPKLSENPSFIFERLLMVIKEATSSSSTTSGNVAPQYHFEFMITDTGLGRFTLNVVNPNYTIRKPIRFDKNITIQFYTPATSQSSIIFPALTVPVAYASTAPFTTSFSNLSGAGFVVGDVLIFSSNDPGTQNNPANAAFFSPFGLPITAVIPLQVTVSGAFTILDGTNTPVLVGTPFIVAPASRVIRIPLRFRTVRTGDGNYITPV